MAGPGSSLPAPRLTCSLDPEFGGRGAQSEWDEGVWDEKVLGAEHPRAFEGAAEGPGWGWLGAGLSASSEVCVTCWTLAGLEPVETS